MPANKPDPGTDNKSDPLLRIAQALEVILIGLMAVVRKVTIIDLSVASSVCATCSRYTCDARRIWTGCSDQHA